MTTMIKKTMNTPTIPINNLKDLNKELRRLREQKRLYSSLLKSDVENVKQQLAPHRLLGYALRDITRNGVPQTSCCHQGLSFASSFLIDRLLFKNAGFIKRFFIKQATSTTIDQAVKGKQGFIGKLVSSFFNRN